jgi:diadenosine tetraphosphate (Ap4A) HIT family hydrolase
LHSLEFSLVIFFFIYFFIFIFFTGLAMSETANANKCLFCRIANGEDEKTQLLVDQDGIVLFKDIRPAAPHHYLVVPKAHIRDPKHLTPNDATMLKNLVKLGTDYLEKQGVDVKDARLGFHWPPFHMVSHLHLHVIAPQSQMRWLSRAIFKPDSWWFKTPEYVLHQLEGTEP